MGIQAAPTVQAVLESADGGVMDTPLSMPIPWAVFAVTAGIKFWRITTVFSNAA